MTRYAQRDVEQTSVTWLKNYEHDYEVGSRQLDYEAPDDYMDETHFI